MEPQLNKTSLGTNNKFNAIDDACEGRFLLVVEAHIELCLVSFFHELCQKLSKDGYIEY